MILQIKPFIGLSVLFLSVFFSCGQTKKTEGLEVIPIEAAYLHPTTLKASDYFRKIRYVPLETNDHALVGSDPVVWISGDRLIVSSNQKQCLSFDKATGRFVSSIGHIGNDPESSQSLFGWMNAAAGHVYFPAGNGRSVVYDKDGNFVGDQQDLEGTNGIYGVDTYDYLDKDILVEHLPATEDKPDRIILFRDTTLLASFPSHGEPHSPLSGAMTDILEMNIHQHTETGYDVIYITFKDGRQNCLVPSEQIFWHKGKDLFFRETFNDTIYQVETTGLTPVKRFDFGTMRWDRKDRYNPEKDQAFYPLDVCESDRILWLRFVVNLHHQEQWKVYNAIYDKINGDVKVAPFKEGIHDDLNGFLPLQPTFATPSGEFAQLVPAGKILEWFEKHTGQEDWPEEIKALKKLTEEDNPVVILME